MQNQYLLINECLEALRQCTLPAIPKLRLEVQLFQIKLLLLRDEVSREIKETSCSEVVLHEIRDQLARLDHSEIRDLSIEAIGRRLQQIGFDLAEAITSSREREERS